MNIYDIDLIMSWTPRQYLLLLKGARHRNVDELERMSYLALMTAKASGEKRVNAKKLFNADKERSRIDNPEIKQEEKKRMVHLNEAFKGFTPQFRKKGG
jgi:hypothetical protein